MSKAPPSTPQTVRSPVQIIEVAAHHQDQRLDNYLLGRLKGTPKSLIYRIIRKGEVRVNGKRCKADYRVQELDKVRVPPLQLIAPDAPVQLGVQLETLLNSAILYDDEQMMVINKPSGLPVHAGTGVKLGLIEALRSMYPEVPGLELVHRLDKGTSGCILLAKTGPARKALMGAFREHEVSKTYHALVCGQWPKGLRVVDKPLLRQPERSGERFVAVDPEGKEARTDFRVLERLGDFTLIEAMPLTGRTHQIRVHAAASGYPLLGDTKYNPKQPLRGLPPVVKNRLYLHASEVEFPHPTSGQRLTCRAQYDDTFSAALKALRARG